jgi:hypothetical protein
MASGHTPDLVASYQVNGRPDWLGWSVVAVSLGLSIYAAIGTLLKSAGFMRFSGLLVLIAMAACMYQMAFVWARRINLTTDGPLSGIPWLVMAASRLMTMPVSGTIRGNPGRRCLKPERARACASPPTNA